MADEPDEPDEKEVKAELIKSLKATRPMFFAFVPKSYQGQLVVCLKKDERDAAAEAAKKDIGGGMPLKGTCKGPLNGKVFTFDKKFADVDKLGVTLQRVVKRTTGLSIVPDIKIKGEREKDEDEEE